MIRRAAILLSALLLLPVAAAPAAPPMALDRRQAVVRFGGVQRPQITAEIVTDAGLPTDSSDENLPGAPGRLRWRNGETLPGEMTGASVDAITWKTPMFEEPLVLDWAALRGYNRPLKPVAPADPFAFALRDGGHVYGDLVAITPDAVDIRSTRHGNARLKRAEILSIRRISRDGLPAGGATGEVDWRLLSDQPGDNGSRPEYAMGQTPRVPPLATGPGGSLAMPYWNTGVFRAMDLPGRIDVEFRVRGSKRPDFLLSFEPTSGESLRVETWDDELVLASGDQFQSLGKVGDAERDISLRLLWDQSANRCQVLTLAGVPLADWHRQSPSAGSEEVWRRSRPGVVLRNKGRDLALELLRIRPWDGTAPTQGGAPLTGVELADGRTIVGDIVGGSAGSVQVRVGGADAVAGFPLAGVDAIVFSMDAPAPKEKPAMVMTWSDGTYLTGQMVGLADGWASVKIPAADSPFPAQMEGLRRLESPTAAKDAAAAKTIPLAQSDQLTVGEMTLHGELTDGDGGQPRWLPVGGKQPATPARGLTYAIRRAKPTPKDGPPAPALFYTSGGDILPGTLRSLDESGVDFKSEYVEATKLRPTDLDAIQFNANMPARIDGFSGSGWLVVKGDPAKVERRDGTLIMEAGAALGHSSAMQCSEMRFDFVTPDAAAIRLRMFSPDPDGAHGVNLALMRSGQVLYYGLETTEGQMESQQGANLPVGGAIPIRLIVTDQQIELIAAGQRLTAIPVPLARRKGSGLVIEPASLWGNQLHSVELANFSAEFDRGRVSMPTVNADAKRQALTVPRFRKDNPPRQALLAMNGDVLRGELLGATADHFAFRAGLENLRVPRDRVRAAVWLKAPAKDAPPAAATPPAPSWLTKRSLLMGQYANMRLRDYVGSILQGDAEMKVRYPSRGGNRRAQIRFDQPTVGEALDLVCAAFDLSYRLEGDTLVLSPAGTPPPGMREAVYWLKPEAFSGPTPVQEALTAKGVTFPEGAIVRWDADSRQLSMTNTAENQRKLAEVLEADFGGSLGTPTHWLLLADGTRLGLAVDRFEREVILGHHPVYGRCRIPLSSVASIRTAAPEPNPAARIFADWRLVPAPEPVLPGESGPGASLVGTEPKPFRLPLLGGGNFDLAEERGKVVVLDFWATWCAPCVQALPGLIEAMAEFSPEQVRFVGVNQAEPAGQVRRFLSAHGWNLTVAMDAEQNVGQQFGAEAIPHTVVIGPDGKVAKVWTGFEPGGQQEVADTVRKLLETVPAVPAEEPGKKSG